MVEDLDLEEQEDELLALHSIFGSDEFVQVRDEPNFAGEIRVSVELPADFSVVLRDGNALRQYGMSFLPPLLLTFELPKDYPSSSPPSFTLTCCWLTHTQLSALGAHLGDLHQATRGTVVLFSWVQFLREEALSFLDICSLLELSSDEQNTLNSLGSTDDQHFPVSEPRKAELLPPTLNVPSPVGLLADGQNPLTPDSSNTNPQGALALKSSETDEKHLTSQGSKVGQNTLNSGPSRDGQKALTSETNADHNVLASDPGKPNQNTSNYSYSIQTTQASDAGKVEQISEINTDRENALSSESGKSDHPPVPQPSQSDQESLLKEEDLSPLLSVHSSSSGPLGQSGQAVAEQAASLPPHPIESVQNQYLSYQNKGQEKDQALSPLPRAPAQTLLSELLVYNEAQKQKVFAATVFDCGVCFEAWPGSECVELRECGHIYCRSCLAQFCKVQITEGNVGGVACPQSDCPATPTPAQVKRLVGEELFSRYDRLLLQTTLDCMPDVTYCPRRTCGCAVILEAGSRAALCSVCRYAFCVSCRKNYHGTGDCQADKKVVQKQGKEKDKQEAYADLPQTEAGMKALWDDYASGSAKRRSLLESRYSRYILQSTLEESLSEGWLDINSKYCPHCYCQIQKDGGCNMMTCRRCGRAFCWACLTRLPAGTNAYQHFQDGAHIVCAAYSQS